MKREERRQAVLAAVEEKRGYVLNYHQLLAADDPELLKAYDELYTRITLRERVLSPKQRELVWLALLCAREEPTGHIHVRRGLGVGLDSRTMADALTITAAAHSYRTLVFSDRHWSADIKTADMLTGYLRIFDAARGDIEPAIAETMGVIAHACLRQFDAMSIHLRRAFEAGSDAAQMREAFSYLLLPCGGNLFIHAVQAWQDAANVHDLPGPADHD